MITQNDIKNAIIKVHAIAEAIREAKQIPSGHLYAMVMSHVSLPEYQKIIDTLKRGGIINEKNNLLKWEVKNDNGNSNSGEDACE